MIGGLFAPATNTHALGRQAACPQVREPRLVHETSSISTLYWLCKSLLLCLVHSMVYQVDGTHSAPPLSPLFAPTVL